MVDPPGEALGTDPGAEAAAAHKPVLRNARRLLTAEIVARGLGFVSSVAIARALTPSLLGEIAIAQTTAQFLGQIGDGGLTLWAQREILRDRRRVSELTTETTVVQLILSLAVVGLLVGLSFTGLFSSGANRLLILFSPFAVGQALSLIYVLQALDEMGLSALVRSGTAVITAIATIALVIATHNPDWVAVSLWGGQLLGDALNLALLRRDGVRAVRVSLARAARLLRFGLPFLGSVMLFHYESVLDTITLGAISTAHQLGEYTPPARLASTALILFQVLVTAAYPTMVRLFDTDRAAFRELMVSLVELAMRITLALAAFAIVAAAPLITLIYGARYGAGAPLLRLLAITVPLGWFGYITLHPLIVAGRQRRYMLILLGQAIVATCLYPPLVSWDGGRGAAIAGVASWSCLAVLAVLATRSMLGAGPVAAVARELPFAVVPAALALLARVVVGSDSLALETPVWLVAVAAIELLRGRPTLRGLALLRGGAPATPSG